MGAGAGSKLKHSQARRVQCSYCSSSFSSASGARQGTLLSSSSSFSSSEFGVGAGAGSKVKHSQARRVQSVLYECGPWANCPEGPACCQAASQQVTLNCQMFFGHGKIGHALRELITDGNCQTGKTASNVVSKEKVVNQGADGMSTLHCVYVAADQKGV